ncbi:carbon-nitrogen hydrolase family protein [Radiobacillus sp. PE A8.2]|uniref:carbon-nitrogen hydrolase family protein n=1 Tax=Radiobacillus sp. PE A8.2 TaxID=3380349 RepID=UPI00389085E4
MVRNAKISTLSMKYHSLDPNRSFEEGVDDMITYLRGEIDQVLPDQPDLIVLPENCDMPINFPKADRREFYKVRGNRILDWLSDVAKEHNCYIAYSATRYMGEDTWLNSTQLIDRQGEIKGTYNKNFPTIGENKSGILSGKDITVVDCDFGRVGLTICFDLNFEQIREKYANAKPDVIVFSSTYHGGMMQEYWAYSCRTHFVGSIGNKVHSPILSPVGQEIASTTNYHTFVTTTVNLDCEVIHIDNHRKKFNEMKKKYGPKIKISDPGYLGAVLVSSETDEFSVEDLIKEYGLELVDDYFNRSIQSAKEHMES